MSLNTNITNLQEILDKVNNLPSNEPQENLEEELNAQTILLEEQNAKIAELAEALANKQAAGVKEYDTCTVKIDSSGGKLFGYCATCFDGKDILYKYKSSTNTNSLGNVTITDVICGSVFSIICEVNSGGNIGTTHLETMYLNIAKGGTFIPRKPGVTATITLSASFNGGGSN